MEIIAADQQFITNLESQFYSRRECVISCLEHIKEIDDPRAPGVRVSSCSGNNDGVFFAYNKICKVYFQIDSKTNGAILKNFIFAHHNV